LAHGFLLRASSQILYGSALLSRRRPLSLLEQAFGLLPLSAEAVRKLSDRIHIAPRQGHRRPRRELAGGGSELGARPLWPAHRRDRDRPSRRRCARAEEARAALDRANAMQVGVSITVAQRLVVERDSRVADAVLMDARKKLALLEAGSRAEDVAEAKAKRDQAATFVEEGKAEFDQCTVRAPAAGTVKVLVTLGQYVSTFAPTTLVQLKPDAK
jgi:hypothetical protein